MPGKGVGEAMEKVGNFTDKAKCINMCKHLQKKNMQINGMMIGLDASDQGCWCVSSMSGSEDNAMYESCIVLTSTHR